MHIRILGLVGMLGIVASSTLLATDPPPPQITTLISTNARKVITWTPYPAAQQYNLLSTRDWNTAFTNDTNGVISGYTYTGTNGAPNRFYSLAVTPLSSNALLTANVLNRLAYGPTPDELERVTSIGPQAYIDEQLAPETVAAPLDSYVAVTTNGVNLPPNSNWISLTVTGTVTSSNLYIYLTDVGQVSVDNVQLRYSYVLTAVSNNAGVITTNITTNITGNLVVNGDFEQPLSPGWTVSANLSGSFIDTNLHCSGASSLRAVASAPGTTQASAIWQSLQPFPVTTRGTNNGVIFTNSISTLRAVLSFAYLPNANSRLLTIRLSGSGTIITGDDEPDPPEWIYATSTGLATATPQIYIFLSGAGDGYFDDMKLVSGTVAESGPNLLVNGDFEQPLTNGWQVTSNFINSYVDNTISHSGGGSLHMVATAGGSGSGNAIFQVVPTLTNGLTYTLSYWYRPATRARTTTVRLSGSLLVSTPDTEAGGLKRRLDDADRNVSIDEMRQWYCRNGVASQRQLLEILTQFFENHFVTYHSKSVDYLDRYYDDFGLMGRIATDMEYHEVSRWRQALLNPNATFYDLLKIHAESPAEIIYLDTVDSRGDGNNIANENYGRELLELFTMGVDNGYDQFDITVMSRAWSGWTIDLVRRQYSYTPFAPRAVEVQQYGFYPGVGFNAVSNRVGVWSFVFDSTHHGTNRAPIFSTWQPNTPATNPVASGPKMVPARFGPPWAGTSYQLTITPNRTGTNGLQDGYDVIRHLASNVPMTAEYISVKLCRLFVHDGFPNPTTRPELPEYAFYDYTNPNMSAEARLVHDCMLAWWNSNPRGNIRAVLRTIFNSDLFRSHGGSRQKIKTPVEFVLSAVRSLRSVDSSGQATAFTDGNFTSPMSRMGGMSLFNRSDPDGYPEAGPPWISAGTLAERLRFVQTLCMDPGQTGGRPSDAGNNTVDPVALVQRKLPSTSWSNAGAVADLFLNYLFQGEGLGNVNLYRTAAINFLDDGSADPTPSALKFNQLTVSTSATSAYDLRVRGMAAMLMTFQRFQEQ